MRGVPFIFRIRKSLSTKITVMNAGIILLIFISLIYYGIDQLSAYPGKRKTENECVHFQYSELH